MEVIVAGIGGLEVIFLAVFALLAMYAFRPLITALIYGLAEVIQQIPGIGDSIASALSNGIDRFYSYVTGWLSTTWQQMSMPLVNAMSNVANNMRYGAYSTRTALQTTAQGFENLVKNVIHKGDAVTTTWTEQSITTIENWTQTLVGNTEQDIVNWTTTAYNNLTEWAKTNLSQTITNITNVQNTVVQDVSILSDGINNAEQTAITYAGQVYDTATAYTTSAVGALGQQTQQEIQGAYDKLAGAIDAAQQWTEGRIQAGEAPIIAGLGAVTTFAISNLLPRVLDIEKEIDSCVKPNCDIANDFFKSLSGITDLLETGALIAFLLAAATEPEATAREAVAAGEALTALPRDIIGSIIGRTL